LQAGTSRLSLRTARHQRTFGQTATLANGDVAATNPLEAQVSFQPSRRLPASCQFTSPVEDALLPLIFSQGSEAVFAADDVDVRPWRYRDSIGDCRLLEQVDDGTVVQPDVRVVVGVEDPRMFRRHALNVTRPPIWTPWFSARPRVFGRAGYLRMADARGPRRRRRRRTRANAAVDALEQPRDSPSRLRAVFFWAGGGSSLARALGLDGRSAQPWKLHARAPGPVARRAQPAKR
jgi:hypothetical protein